LSFLEDGNREALRICGRKSGRDCDKITEAGLSLVTEGDYAYFAQSRLTVVAKKLYVSRFEEGNFIDKSIIDSAYPNRDYHDIYMPILFPLRHLIMGIAQLQLKTF
jgi:hypothetical protein